MDGGKLLLAVWPHYHLALHVYISLLIFGLPLAIVAYNQKYINVPRHHGLCRCSQQIVSATVAVGCLCSSHDFTLCLSTSALKGSFGVQNLVLFLSFRYILIFEFEQGGCNYFGAAQ